MKWFHRIAERIAQATEHVPKQHVPEHTVAISELFYRRSVYASGDAFLSDLLELFPAGEPLTDSDLRVLLGELRGIWGAEQAMVDGELPAQRDFWLGLAARTNSAYAHACYADTLLALGHPAQAVEAFALALELAPSLLPEMARDLDDVAQSVGGKPYLHFCLAKLAAFVSGEVTGEEDESRELYSELLEEFAGDGEALERIRYHGKALADAVKRGDLPRTMVRRAERSVAK